MAHDEAVERAGLSDAPRALDPELAALATLIPTLDIADARAARQMERAISSEMRRGPVAGVKRDIVDITRPDGTTLEVSVHRPTRASRPGPLPVLLFLHGGSFVVGGLHTEEARCEYYAAAVGCAVVSVEYRLAPEHPYPAALDDCLVALHWLMTDADQQDLDARRVAVGGLSAGGTLAAATALWCRDAADDTRGLPGGGQLATTFPRPPRPMLQLLLHPALDASVSTHSATTFTDTPILTAGHLALMWRLYLGHEFTASDMRGLASPAHAADLAHLPPAYIAVSQFDPLRDECLRYAQRLIDADVPVEFHHYSRAFHSFDSFSASRMGRNAMIAQAEALTTAFR